MAAKKTTKKTTAKKQETEELAEEIVEAVEPVEKKYKIIFESANDDRVFYEPGVKFKMNDVTKKLEKIKVIKPITLKAGQTKVLNQDEYDFLMDKGLLKSQEELEDIADTRRRLLKRSNARREPKEEMQVISDEDKVKMFIDLPRLVEEE